MITGRLLLFLGALAVVALAPLFVPPAEDAVILFQYADNWAKTGSISYVTNGPHVEGATDFLWMAILAFFRWLGFSPHAVIGPLNALSLYGIGRILSRVAPSPYATRVLLVTPTVFLITPQAVAALSGFSVLPMGFLLTFMFWAFVERRSKTLPVVALLLCLLRPDGVVFSVPLLAFDLARRNFAATAWKDQLLCFLLPAMLYTIWRVYYFHHWFPLPFLVKSQAERWLGIVVAESLQDMSRYLAFALLTLAMMWRWNTLNSDCVAIAVAGILMPSLFYLTLRLDQNLADRFFFFLLLVPSFLLCMQIDHFASWGKRDFLLSATVLLTLFLWPYCFALVHLYTDRFLTNSLVARQIAKKGLHGHLAVSEAGMLPYVSGWPTTDLWGLNTPRFARSIPKPEDIASLHADLLVLRYSACKLPASLPLPQQTRTWSHMANNIFLWGRASDYTEFVLPYNQSRLASAVEKFTDGKQTYLCYFIRGNEPDIRQLESILAQDGGILLSAPITSESARFRATN